jgi:hypothetical protein
MSIKYFDSLFGGDSDTGIKLCMGITGGDFPALLSGGYLVVYRGQDGNIDDDTIVAFMRSTDSRVSIPYQALAANTIWSYIRRLVSDCGLESPDSPDCIVRIEADGDMILAAPNKPMNLTLERLADAKMRLCWRYTAIGQEVPPSGFNIYVDSGSGFNFGSPDAVKNVPGGNGEYSWTSASLVNGQRYKFCVRAFRSGEGETQNTDYVSGIADSVGPDAIEDIWATVEML